MECFKNKHCRKVNENLHLLEKHRWRMCDDAVDTQWLTELGRFCTFPSFRRMFQLKISKKRVSACIRLWTLRDEKKWSVSVGLQMSSSYKITTFEINFHCRFFLSKNTFFLYFLQTFFVIIECMVFHINQKWNEMKWNELSLLVELIFDIRTFVVPSQ